MHETGGGHGAMCDDAEIGGGLLLNWQQIARFRNNLKGDGNMPFFAFFDLLSKSFMQSGGTGSCIGGQYHFG